MAEPNGYDQAKATADRLKKESEEAKQTEAHLHESVLMTAPGVEKHSQLAKAGVVKNMPVAGLEDVPLSMLPIPFYKLVQPGSTKVTMSNGKDAEAGNFFMGDTKDQTSELVFALLRAKRQVRPGDGNRMIPSMGVLAFNMIRQSPFILGLSTSSFAAFGTLMAQIKERKMKTAWEYPVKATTYKVEEQKMTEKGLQMVKYYKVSFELLDEKVNETDFQMLTQMYEENATKLDRQNEEPTIVDGVPMPGDSDIPF